VLPFVSLTGSDRHAGTAGVKGQLMWSIRVMQEGAREVSDQSRCWAPVGL